MQKIKGINAIIVFVRVGVNIFCSNLRDKLCATPLLIKSTSVKAFYDYWLLETKTADVDLQRHLESGQVKTII